MSEKVLNFAEAKENAGQEEMEAVETAQEVDNLFRLEEMCDSMLQSITNVEKISNEQIELCHILENTETENDFSSFIQATRRQTENLSAQSATLALRQSLLNQVICKCKENEEIKEVVMQLIDALGVFA